MSVFYYILQAAVLTVAQETKKIADSKDQKGRGYHVLNCVYCSVCVTCSTLSLTLLANLLIDVVTLLANLLTGTKF